ncbi:xylose isomerase-like protein [Exophiala viscosa]|uniref:Xylose isomerase-like protein n=1 Tax=Exophiala viscosa TaxID=2486360 RepID=A0AAN6IBZ0_9EURO|nr:xylose isomerase-like protein [Exophiala viscosa]
MGARFIPTIASQSLGRAWHHNLEHKLSLCQRYAFESIELFFEDLDGIAQSLPVSHPPSSPGTSFAGSTDTQERQLAAAAYIHELCLAHELEILCIQPFMHYEGRLDSSSHQAAIQDLHFWIRLVHTLGTDLIQIPSSFLDSSNCTGSRDILVAELREAADIGLRATPPIRFAYEALAWGTHVDTWDAAWSIVQEVDRPNFGTCIDTFNLAGRIFADPASPTGLTPNALEDSQKSIAKIRSELSLAIDKVFYVEVCDGERLDAPLLPGHAWYNAEQPPRMSWSRNARLFPFEKPGYLPVLEILEAVCEAGYTGHISFELFSRTANQPDKEVPEQHAKRAAIAWQKLSQHMRWDSPRSIPEDGHRYV